MKVLIRAPLLTNSGYGVHSRQIFEWLHDKKDIELTAECLNWGQTPWIIDTKLENGLIGKIMDHSRNLKDKYDLTFQIQLPDEWNPNLGSKNVGISAFVETDKCSSTWVEKCNTMNQIIVPSTFTKNIVKRSGPLKTNITVVPEWYNHNLLNNPKMSKIIASDSRYNFNTNFNILMIGQLTSMNPDDDRKNLINSLSLLCKTFENNKDVGIVLKTNFGRGTQLDRRITSAEIRKLLGAFRKSNFPKIHLIHGNMTSEEIAALYHHPKIKMFASATRGEGYGLPLIDAAVAGLPIVVTGWSGHFEFLDRSLVNHVKYSIQEISERKCDNRIFFKGFKWAEPSGEDFCNQVVNVYSDYKKAKEKAKILKKKVTVDFHKTRIKKMYDKIINEI